MCTRVLQDEVAKRRAMETALRPLARAVFTQSLDNTSAKAISDVIGEARALVTGLGIRECCYTFPSERHTKECQR